MPYIDDQRRKELNLLPAPRNAGELNYMLTKLVSQYVREKLSYQRINDVVGALEGAKLEFVRRVVNPYEDNKIEENGDVYQ
jgi:hypothetical protein